MAAKRICATALEAVDDVVDGASILVQSFGPPQAWPTDLLLALRERGVKALTIICNSPAGGPTSLQILAELHQIRKLICTYAMLPTTPTPIAAQIRAGEIELEMVPQGTLVERVRAGGAGLAAFYTPTGVGTAVVDLYTYEDCHTGIYGSAPIVVIASKIVRCTRGTQAYSRLQYVFVGGSPLPAVPAGTKYSNYIAAPDRSVPPRGSDHWPDLLRPGRARARRARGRRRAWRSAGRLG
jgi:acyl CoA:acetate/3-ketoacid CoA transferase alpha subunit